MLARLYTPAILTAAILWSGSAQAQEVPRIFAGTNGEIEATYTNNCVVYYDASGRQKQSNSNCSNEQVRRADTGVAAYRREQGMDGHAGNEHGSASEFDRPPADDYADGFAGGPDYWAVTGLTEGDRLNVRSEPSTKGRILWRLSHGDRVRNLGCREIGSGRWCRVDLGNGTTGYASQRYLAEAPGAVAANQGSNLLESNCLTAVGNQVGRRDLSVIRSDFSEAATGVYISVPGAGAPWLCVVSRDGTVNDVRYTGSEGAL